MTRIQTTRTKATATTKYRDLSTAHRTVKLSDASVEMTLFLGAKEEQATEELNCFRHAGTFVAVYPRASRLLAPNLRYQGLAALRLLLTLLMFSTPVVSSQCLKAAAPSLA